MALATSLASWHHSCFPLPACQFLARFAVREEVDNGVCPTELDGFRVVAKGCTLWSVKRPKVEQFALQRKQTSLTAKPTSYSGPLRAGHARLRHLAGEVRGGRREWLKEVCNLA
jgi:hypothetical protein